MRFVNQAAFDDAKSRQMATGMDMRTKTAVLDLAGKVLFYAQTGGILNPSRFELTQGATVYRFGAMGAGGRNVAKGGWWLEREAFDKIFSFAQVWSISVGMAMRTLCLVPPEWSEATLLIRARISDPLLAWRGLANAVVTPAPGGGPVVKMPTQNDIAARRLNQLFIPGLADLTPMNPGLRLEQDYTLSKSESVRGFIYT